MRKSRIPTGCLGRSIDNVANLMMTTVFIIIMVIGVYIIVAAYHDLNYANLRMIQVLEEISAHLRGQSAITDDQGNLLPIADAFQQRIESLGDSGLQSSTVSFLFAVFGMSITAASVQILARANRRIEIATDKTKQLVPLIEGISEVAAIQGLFVTVCQATWFAQAAEDDLARASYLQQIRDSLTRLQNKLLEADRHKLGIDHSSFVTCLDLSGIIGTNLQKLVSNKQIEDMRKIQDTCDQLLRTSGFVGRYEAQLSALLDNPGT